MRETFRYEVGAPPKKPVIYQRGDRRVMAHSLRALQSTLAFSDVSAFSAHSAVKLEGTCLANHKITQIFTRKQKINCGHRLTQINTDDENQHG